ncbi:hypothetical protein CR513_40142, partial [Mucuna pruriens]
MEVEVVVLNVHMVKEWATLKTLVIHFMASLKNNKCLSLKKLNERGMGRLIGVGHESRGLDKLSARAIKCVFLGYPHLQKGIVVIPQSLNNTT